MPLGEIVTTLKITSVSGFLLIGKVIAWPGANTPNERAAAATSPA
jgi:hypothetical protein